MCDCELLERARRVMAGDRYAVEATGIEIVEVGESVVRCIMAIGKRHSNVRGVVMGGALFTLADFSAAVLVNYDCIVHDTPFQWVTASSEIHFLAAASGKSLTANSRYVKRGRSMSVMQTDIHDDNQCLVACITTTSMRINGS